MVHGEGFSFLGEVRVHQNVVAELVTVTEFQSEGVHLAMECHRQYL